MKVLTSGALVRTIIMHLQFGFKISNVKHVNFICYIHLRKHIPVLYAQCHAWGKNGKLKRSRRSI